MINFIQNLVKQFQKKKEESPLPFPYLPSENLTPDSLFNILQNGTAIWAWYNVLEDFNAHTWAYTDGYFYGFAVFRKEGNYLFKYGIDIDEEQRKFYLVLREITRFTASNVIDLLNNELEDAYRIHWDPDDLTSNYDAYVHTVTEEEIESCLEFNQVMYLTRDHYPTMEDVISDEKTKEKRP